MNNFACKIVFSVKNRKIKSRPKFHPNVRFPGNGVVDFFHKKIRKFCFSNYFTLSRRGYDHVEKVSTHLVRCKNYAIFCKIEKKLWKKTFYPTERPKRGRLFKNRWLWNTRIRGDFKNDLIIKNRYSLDKKFVYGCRYTNACVC